MSKPNIEIKQLIISFKNHKKVTAYENGGKKIYRPEVDLKQL